VRTAINNAAKYLFMQMRTFLFQPWGCEGGRNEFRAASETIFEALRCVLFSGGFGSAGHPHVRMRYGLSKVHTSHTMKSPEIVCPPGTFGRQFFAYYLGTHTSKYRLPHSMLVRRFGYRAKVCVYPCVCSALLHSETVAI